MSATVDLSLHIARLAPEFPTLDALLHTLGGLEIQCLAAPYPSDHARTLLLAAPLAAATPACVIKIARLPSAEAYMQNAALLRPQLPERYGRLRLIFPEWQGRIAGQLASIEPFARGHRVTRGATGELLREWLALSEELGPKIEGLADQIITPDAVTDFLTRHDLSANLAAIIKRNEAWFHAPSTLCHGDLSPHNVLRHQGDLCIIDWDFCRRVSLRRFDGFYALLSACQPLKKYDRLLPRFALMLRRHGAPLRWKSTPDEALTLVLLFLAIHSEEKNQKAGFPPDSPYLQMLRQRWANSALKK